MVKNLPAKAGDMGLIHRSRRSSGEGNGNPLQYSCLGNPTDRGAWWATVHGVAKSWTRLKQLRAHTGILENHSSFLVMWFLWELPCCGLMSISCSRLTDLVLSVWPKADESELPEKRSQALFDGRNLQEPCGRSLCLMKEMNTHLTCREKQSRW